KMPSLKHRVVVKVRDNQPVYAIKHTVFSPHTARRIFASQLFYGWFTKPMPASYCMHYTGHKKESSFLRYINAKTKEIAEKALEYFDYPNMKVSGYSYAIPIQFYSCLRIHLRGIEPLICSIFLYVKRQGDG